MASSASGSARGNAGNGVQLKAYWLTGAGAAKIRWNTDGDFTRCVREIRKYAAKEGFSAEGYCARLHKAATGTWPGDKKNVG